MIFTTYKLAVGVPATSAHTSVVIVLAADIYVCHIIPVPGKFCGVVMNAAVEEETLESMAVVSVAHAPASKGAPPIESVMMVEEPVKETFPATWNVDAGVIVPIPTREVEAIDSTFTAVPAKFERIAKVSALLSIPPCICHVEVPLR